MTYDQLAAFLAVAGEGGFTAASGALHKTQPAVSKLVRNLEDELGVALFDRRSYRATLTDAGRVFREHATAVVEQTHALRTLGRRLAGRVEPIVRVAIEAVTPLPPLLAILRDLQTRHPTVRFALTTERLAGAAEALGAGHADVAIATTIGTRGAKLALARYATVRIVPVARPDHPVATRGTPAPPAVLRAHPQIVLRDSAADPGATSLNVLEGGLRWSVTDVTAKREVIGAGMGWGGLPEHVVADALAAGTLVRLDVPEFETEALELFVMRRRDVAHGVVADALWEALRAAGATPQPPAPSRARASRRTSPSRRRTRRASRRTARSARAN